MFLGRGDWRQAGCVEEALAYNRPLRTSVAAAHAGPLPARARLLRVRPAPGGDADGGTGDEGTGGRAVLAVVKPAGNSLTSGA